MGSYKKYVGILFILSMCSFNSYAGADAFDNKLCNFSQPGWKNDNNLSAAGYEYCVTGAVFDQVINLTQSPIYVSTQKGKVQKVQGESKFKLAFSRRVHFLSEENVRFYRISRKLVIADDNSAKSAKERYKSLMQNISFDSGEAVQPFRVKTIGYEAPIFIGSFNEKFAQKGLQLASSSPMAVGPGIIIGTGAATGSGNAWDSDKACGGDIVRGGIVGGLSAAAGLALALPGGVGFIVAAAATWAVNRSLTGICASCHVSYCDDDTEESRHGIGGGRGRF
ncbi:hypothetical protein VH1709_contig00010-0202 [Vibrio harveyi]|uniref:hypothetical protein n=1 Tax=Vibrio harveyi TaxID=669 RepID=UPI000D7898E0|nr:hypothetical protein [Vibrio harveyi]GBK97664.1 hypothetical protein VH1709_contig00010-0202 [Vibrio harveyi]